MIYNNYHFRYLDNYNLEYPKTCRTKEYYDPFDIQRPYQLKYDYIEPNINKLDVIATYNVYSFGSKVDEMKGSGIQSLASGISKAIEFAQTGQQLYDAYGSELATTAKNIYGKYINPDPNWRPAFAGEHHLINEKGVMYNYAGPQTQIVKRLKRGDPPIDEIDALAQIHDIEYAKAKTYDDIKKSDLKLSKGVAELKGHEPLRTLISKGIKGKVKAQDLGLINKGAFVGNILQDGNSIEMNEDKKKIINDLKQLGYGKKKKKITKAKRRKSNIITKLQFSDEIKEIIKPKDPLSRLKKKIKKT